jgi:hypothetical protein
LLKSSIHFSKNTVSSTINSISGIFPFKRASVSSKYLGLPLLFGKAKTSAFKDILEKVSGKIEGWRAKTLSQAGRSVFVKSVAATIISYAMSSFLLPISITSSLDRTFKSFLWGFPKDKARNLSLKSWNSICLPKDEGSLGFRRMHDFNLSLISKLGWKLLSNSDCLWVNQLQKKYIKYGNFISSPNVSSSSWIWKGIQKIKPLISAGACLTVSRNSTASIWSTNWVPSLPSFRPLPKFPSNKNPRALLIRDLIDPTLSRWKVPAVTSLFDSFSAQAVLNTRISTEIAPTFLWTPSTSGKFSVSSAYSFITGSSTNTSISPIWPQFWNSIWKLKLNDRLRLFLWKIAWNILPTTEQLGHLFNVHLDFSCPLCKIVEDFLYHLFFGCTFARIVWRHSFWSLDSTKFNFSSMADWIKIIISPCHSLGIPRVDYHKFQIFASVACDILWYYRNQAFHTGNTFEARNVSMHINKIAFEHFQAWQSISSTPLEKWIPLAPNWVKINFDTAIRDSFSAQAAVCRNSDGKILHLSSLISFPCSVNEGEAFAAQLAISLACSFNFNMFILEGDSDVVIQALNQSSSISDWRISPIIDVQI